MMFFRVCVFLLLFFVFAPSASAVAAEINEQGASALKRIFSEILETQKIGTSFGNGELILGGEVQVEKAASYYAVTLPHISFRGEDGNLFEVGMIAVNAVPTDDPELWKMSVAVPSPMIGHDADGNPVLSFDIGRQVMSGLWHTVTGSFVSMDASYENLVLRAGPENDGFRLPLMTINYDLENDGQDNWSGPAEIVMEDIQVIAEGEEVLFVDGISAKSNVRGMSARAIGEYREKITALGTSAKDGQANMADMHNLLFDFFGGLCEEIAGSFVVEGLRLRTPAGEDGPERKIEIGKAGFGIDMNGLKNEKIELAYRMLYEDFSAVPPFNAGEGLAPTGMNLDVSVRELPLRELTELGKQTLETSLKSPEMAQISGMQAVMTLPQLLSRAGTFLEIGEISVTGPQYDFRIKGNITADASAPYGMTAQALGTAYGLDGVIAELTARVNDPQTPEAEKNAIGKNMQALAAAQLMGRQEQDGQGRNVRTYDFQIDNRGRMMLNGGDFSALLGQADQPDRPSGQSAPETAPPAASGQ